MNSFKFVKVEQRETSIERTLNYTPPGAQPHGDKASRALKAKGKLK